jgi:hypothetical protein
LNVKVSAKAEVEANAARARTQSAIDNRFMGLLTTELIQS